MKHLRKVLALVLAASLAFMPVTPAFAEDDPAPADPTPAATTDYDHPLTITGLAEGDVAHFYQILEWVDNAEGNVAGWKAKAPFNTVLTEAELTKVLVGVKDNPATTDVDETKPATGITSELAGQLARKVGTTASTDVTVAEGETSAVLDNAAAGMYMAIITPADIDTVYNPVFVSADFNKDKPGNVAVDEKATYSDTAAAKKSTVGLDKSVEKLTNDYSPTEDYAWTTTRIGETVSFAVETTIPGYGEVYENPFFKVTDKLTDLKLVPGTVKLTAPADLTDAQVTITEAQDGKSYTVQFDSAYLKTLKVPTDVKITYDAIVTTTAPLHVNNEKNEVSTEFSHNPKDEEDHAFKRDTTEHYSFTIDASGLGCEEEYAGKKTSEVVKVGIDAKGDPINKTNVKESEITQTNTWTSPLEGAEFQLYTDEACKNQYVPLKTDGSADTAKTYTTDANGRLGVKDGDKFELGIRGLDVGTYYLKETKAPTGFVKDNHVAEIVIAATTEELTITDYTTDGETWITAAEYATKTDEQKAAYKSYTYKTRVLKSYTVTIDDVETAKYNFTNDGSQAKIDWTEEPPVELPHQFKNTEGVELPSTGGMGTRILYTIGGIMLVGGAIALVSKKRAANME